jgi:hypothetical protein
MQLTLDRQRESWRVVRDTMVRSGVKETIFSVLKVCRQCPLVPLVGLTLVLEIN